MLSSAKEALKQRIQNETHTTIAWSKIKTDGSRKRVIEIKGATHNEVYTARQQIKSLKSDGRKSDAPTHFTCVKISAESIKENFLNFKVGQNESNLF